ncbi:divalent metal cation transporter [Rubritalea spongiae]|uniref:Divalent metal cation transporter n=1 Tax=Rubritalea spongiae TaxID=430797 RepID=A0ABW5E7B0_9BACT
MSKLLKYAKQSGPGWLQAAVTLGGGSLVGALYLGVIGGNGLLWLQPMAMVFGVIMLASLAYVTLSTEETPFVSTCKHISPVLAWAWLIATVIADCVFCPAQASLGLGIVQQNFGLADVNPYIITSLLAVTAFGVVYFYSSGSKGVATFENILKIMVAIVILCFFGSATVNMANGNVDFPSLIKGFIPNFTALFNPAETLQPAIAATGEAASYWSETISHSQRDIIITAFGAAVGINMTFLLPYTLKKRGWEKKDRELSRYDLVLGLAIPFMIAASFLVITSSAQFHGKSADVLNEAGQPIALEDGYYANLKGRLQFENIEFTEKTLKEKADQLPLADREIAAYITKRDAKQLATALAPLVGSTASQMIFGIGILAMALSTMIVHMLMNGFAISQAIGKPEAKKPFLIGAAIPAVTAALAPYLWSGANKTAMAIPASVIATTLLPIAYLIFVLLMNSKHTLGKEKLTGGKLITVNILMLTGLFLAGFASVWALLNKGTPGVYGLTALAVLAALGLISFAIKNKSAKAS